MKLFVIALAVLAVAAVVAIAGWAMVKYLTLD